MKITKDEVQAVAKLARLELDGDKLGLFAGQFNEILDYMDLLGELDTDAVEPLYSPVTHMTRMREDAPRKDFTREEVLSNAPEADGRFFIVPKIV
jgi:aspartyl-tRNA(Asn)/glutamyl-tRNA(Gln) amidotransferase subunit C